MKGEKVVMYYVYVHTLPNGKIYIGQTKDLKLRWNNGEGYIDNKPFYKDIQIYGWNNIKHEIIASFNDREAAIKLEAVLIALKKSENSEYGYNQTSIYDTAIKKYISKTEISGVSLENADSEISFLESFNLPISACKEMIDQWIFNEEHRTIMKSRLIDGMTYPEMSKKHNKSIRRLKQIVYDGCAKLEKHI